MNLIRLVLAVGAGWAFPIGSGFAHGTSSPLVFDKTYSAEQVITSRDGAVMTNKIYNDNGRIRTEMTAHGMNMVAIVLPAEKKVYSVLPDQQMVMVVPYDPAKYSKYLVGTPQFNGKIDRVGSESVEGTACDKYKVTTDNKVYFLWVDPAKKQPVKMASEDGSFTAVWKNYQPGPQAAALFEIPPDYKVMNMPSMPNMPDNSGQ